ncbi:MAG TPA: GH25 family lysozyme [Xanthobacteraceae bacterium]|nr:GH25 family lysozyme [Xanthobacteraceae bacterium]
MTYAIRCGLVAVVCGLVVAGLARARDAGANMDGPSRAELFELRWKSDLGPNASTLGPKLMQPFFIPKHILGDAVYGISLSYHNDEGCACKGGDRCPACKIDWSRIASNKIAFVFVKATHGARYTDPTFQYHWRALARHKIHRGARHFLSADEDPVEQADHFVEQLEAAGKLMASDLPPVLELERDLRRDTANRWIVVAETGQRLDFWQGQDPDEIVGKILKWLNRVEQKTGRVPIIYTSRGWWMERIKDEKKFALLRRYPLWIADYPESGRHAHDSPKVPNTQAWTIWQFTENGRMEEEDIIPGNVEVSVFRGTLARFRQALKVSAAEAEVARAEDNKSARGGQQMAAASPQQVSDASDANVAAPPTGTTQSGAAAGATNASQAAAPAIPDVAAAAGKQPPVAATATQTAAAAAAAPPAKSNQTGRAPPQAAQTASDQVASVENPAPLAVGSSPPQQVRQPPPPQAAQQSRAPQQGQKSESVSARASAAGKEAPDSGKSPQSAAPATEAPATQALSTQTAVVAQAPQASAAVAIQPPASANTAPQASTPQVQTAQSVKPAPQAPATSANASERADATPEASREALIEQKAPPAPQVAAANLASVKETAGLNQGGTAPTAGVEKAKTESQKANTASVAPPSRLAQRSSGQRAATEKAAEENSPGERAPTDKPAAERIMIEIELLNGRKLRVDANIDPTLLERLINAIDK